MIYNLKRVTSAYVKGFCDYIKLKNFDIRDTEYLYDLFSFAIKNIYGFPSCESNYYIDQYGDNCISYLKKVRGVPKKVNKLDTNDRIAIVTMSISYFLAVGLLSDSKYGDDFYECKESL